MTKVQCRKRGESERLETDWRESFSEMEEANQRKRFRHRGKGNRQQACGKSAAISFQVLVKGIRRKTFPPGPVGDNPD